MYTSWPWWTAKDNCMLATWLYILCLPPICYGMLGSTVPKLSSRPWLCFSIRLIFLKNILVYSVWIINMIGYLSSSVDSAVGLNVFKLVVWYFKSLTIMAMSSRLWNYCRMYFFSFFLNFLNWPLASLWLAVVPNTAPKLSTSSLKFLIYDVYSGRLKLPLHPPRSWWPPLLVLPPQPHLRLPFLALDSLD